MALPGSPMSISLNLYPWSRAIARRPVRSQGAVEPGQRPGVGRAGVVGDARRDQLARVGADGGPFRGFRAVDCVCRPALLRIRKMLHNCNYRASINPPVNG